jgi:hypothetical protein
MEAQGAAAAAGPRCGRAEILLGMGSLSLKTGLTSVPGFERDSDSESVLNLALVVSVTVCICRSAVKLSPVRGPYVLPATHTPWHSATVARAGLLDLSKTAPLL